MDKATEIFERHRPYLYRLAYGMLGRASLAEDMVQETWLRWRTVAHDRIDSERAYLGTIVSRLCLDELKSARSRREEYIGPFLPEPLVDSGKRTPEEEAELADSLSMAMMVVLENLSPVQRAVFLLREVFGYGYESIADVIDKSAANCRKIAQRARERVEQKKPRYEPKPEKQRQLLQSFMDAVNKGDVNRLEQLLAEDAVVYSDGGGEVTAARKPIFGAEKIIRFMLGTAEKTPGDVEIDFREINGRPGLIVWFGERLHSVWSFQIERKRIKNIYIVLNPDKLNHLLDSED